MVEEVRCPLSRQQVVSWISSWLFGNFARMDADLTLLIPMYRSGEPEKREEREIAEGRKMTDF
jgi:hypothetical protein